MKKSLYKGLMSLVVFAMIFGVWSPLVSSAQTLSTNSTPQGYVDVANCDIIAGWAYDPDEPAVAIAVHIYKNGPAGSGTFVTSTIANLNRSDVGARAFQIATPSELKNGQAQTIYVHGIDTSGNGLANVQLSGSPKTFTCTQTYPELVITTTSLPNAKVGQAYSATLTATGGSGNNMWLKESGTLPNGITLSQSGVLSGTPTTAGTHTVGVYVRSNNGSGAEYTRKNLTLTVDEGVAEEPLSITTTTLPNAKVGQAYRTTVSATGGSETYVWSISSGSLPAGLSLTADIVCRGICKVPISITGTPTTAGTSTVTMRVASGTQVATKQITIVVEAQTSNAVSLTINSPSSSGITLGTVHNISWTATNAPAGAMVDLAVERNGSNRIEIAYVKPATGTYSWIPSSIWTAGSGYQIVATLHKDGATLATARSNEFTLNTVLATDTLAVALDPATSVSKTLTPGSFDNSVATFKLSAVGATASVTSLSFGVPATYCPGTYKVYDGATLLGQVSTSVGSACNFSISNLNLSIPANSSKQLTVKVDLPSVTAVGSFALKLVSVGTTSTISGLPVTANTMTVSSTSAGPLLSVAPAPLSTTSLYDGVNELLKFTATASNGDASIQSVTFSVNTEGVWVRCEYVSDFRLFENGVEVTGLAVWSQPDQGCHNKKITFNSPRLVANSIVNTYELLAIVTNAPVFKSISTTLRGSDYDGGVKAPTGSNTIVVNNEIVQTIKYGGAPSPVITVSPDVLVLNGVDSDSVYFDTTQQMYHIVGNNLSKKVNELSSKPVDFIIVLPDFGNQSQFLLLQHSLPGTGVVRAFDPVDPNTKGIVLMGGVKDLMDQVMVTDEVNLEQQSTVISHEIAHFFGSFHTDPRMYLTDKNDGCFCHYDSGMFWPGATKIDPIQAGNLLWSKGKDAYGNNFILNNPIGTYFTPETKHFNPLTLYLMGLISKEEVPPIHIIRPTDSKNYYKGVEEVYTIEDFIDVYGPREPAYPNTQRVFTARVVLLQTPNSNITQQEADFVSALARKIPETFFKLTGGKGGIELVSESSTISLEEPVNKTNQTVSERHPRGTVVLDSEGVVWFLGAEVRYPFPTPEVFFSWGHTWSSVVKANQFDLAMPKGPIVDFKTQ